MPTDHDNQTIRFDRIERQIRTTIAAGGRMSKHRAAYNRATNALADHIVKPGQMLAELERDKDRFPPAFVEQERRRLLAWARDHDSEVTEAMTRYISEVSAEARKLRTQADADRPAVERTAEMLERQQILAANPRAADLLALAEDALAAERPRRAAFLLAVAQEVGGVNAGDLPQRVEDALDADDDKRSTARAMEDEAAGNYRELEILRFRALAAAGVGIGEDGTAGRGTASDVARANVARKMAAFASGGDYSDPAAPEPQAAGSAA